MTCVKPIRLANPGYIGYNRVGHVLRGGVLMRLVATLGVVLAVLTIALFLFPVPAHAYLDPGTGSYLLQVALAALVGTLFAVRLFWGRIKAFFQKLFARDNEEENGD
jgi:hypothetical protein